MNERNYAYSEQGLAAGQLVNATSITVVQGKLGVVDSLLHPLAILIRRVLTRSGRMELSLILIDDEENILQALDAGVAIHSVFYAGGEGISPMLMQSLPSDVHIHEVAKRTCKKLFENDKTSRVFAIAYAPATGDLGGLLEIRRDIVALEDLTISGNIGAIIRTSLAFGAGGIVLLNVHPADIYDRRLIRASRGHVFSLPILTATTEELIRFCHQKNLPILVMAAQAAHPVHEVVSLPGPLVIVFGSEKEGCSKSLKEAATLQVQIPTNSRVESLNVSTAAGIMLYNRTSLNIPQARK
jgi:23S rRNA (adenosine1067-2'-O)-methyltransferase